MMKISAEEQTPKNKGRRGASQSVPQSAPQTDEGPPKRRKTEVREEHSLYRNFNRGEEGLWTPDEHETFVSTIDRGVAFEAQDWDAVAGALDGRCGSM